eukprot:2962697-Rhodomonas_salina.3
MSGADLRYAATGYCVAPVGRGRTVSSAICYALSGTDPAHRAATGLRAFYTEPGTDLGYAATSAMPRTQSDLKKAKGTAYEVCSYAHAMLSGTAKAYGYAATRGQPVVWGACAASSGTTPPMLLRACYALSGTDLARVCSYAVVVFGTDEYRTTHALREARVPDPKSPYALATRCPVLAYCTVLYQPGTDLLYCATPAWYRATRLGRRAYCRYRILALGCNALAMQCPAMVQCMSYGARGTNWGYGTTAYVAMLCELMGELVAAMDEVGGM